MLYKPLHAVKNSNYLKGYARVHHLSFHNNNTVVEATNNRRNLMKAWLNEFK